MSAPGAALRLFVAVELPDDVRRALAGAIATLRAAVPGDALRWVRPEGIHVTLKFLGAVQPHQVDAIAAGINAAVHGIAPFDLQPDGFGAFHGGKQDIYEHRGSRETYHYNLRVLWVGVSGDTDALSTLAARVEERLAPLGFPTERRKFSAHLTLARMREQADRPSREATWEALVPYLSKSTEVVGRFRPDLVPRFPAFTVARVSLMQSMLQRGGSVYHALASADLDG